MERRTFVKGAFGLVALVCATGFHSVQERHGCPEGAIFVTPGSAAPEAAVGPAMVAGIELEAGDAGETWGTYAGERLFAVDDTGAELVMLADGSLSLGDIAERTSVPVRASDVASFFVTLGQAGYLQNEVYVNIVEVSV